MSNDDIAQLAYLTLLGAVILGYFLIAQRRNLGRIFQQLILWGLLFVGVASGFALWENLRYSFPQRQSVISNGSQIETRRRLDGHYYLTLQINGEDIEFVVDTGASEMVLSKSDAEKVGIVTAGLDFWGRAKTANGEVQTARVVLDDVRLGPIADRHVEAWVNDGDMQGSLLGMGYLNRFAAIEIRGNRLILTR